MPSVTAPWSRRARRLNSRAATPSRHVMRPARHSRLLSVSVTGSSTCGPPNRPTCADWRPVMRRDLPYVATLALLALVALPADLAALQALPLGSGMQLLLASGLAGLTALAAHVGARALTDLIDTWPQRH